MPIDDDLRTREWRRLKYFDPRRTLIELREIEIDLIKRALFQTGGHQVQAAKLLNLKVTTLNSKIKHYNISPGGFATVYPMVETLKIEDRQHAL